MTAIRAGGPFVSLATNKGGRGLGAVGPIKAPTTRPSPHEGGKVQEHTLSSVSGRQARSRRVSASRAGSGAAGVGLLLGGGAVYFLERASTEALATTSRVLLTTGLAGLFLMTVVVAVRLFALRHGPRGRPPGHWIYLVPDAGALRPIPVRVTSAPTHEGRRSA